MATSPPQQPKSILKKSESSLPDISSLPIRPKTDQEKRRLAIAVQHARLLQDQKDVLSLNLNSIEYLAELPSSSTVTQDEIVQFTTRVMSFQPSDYDALIEERHVMNRCGYTLCPNPPRKRDAKRPWLRAKGSENWCSDFCAKQALYIKAQLDETPAWERRGGAAAPIQLYGERGSRPLQATLASEDEQKRNEQRSLALERGQGKVASFHVDATTSTEVLENTPTRPAKAPSPATSGEDLIEGYKPKGSVKKGGVRFENDDGDEEDTDWNL